MFRIKRFQWLSLFAVLIMVLVSIVPAAADAPPLPTLVTNIDSNFIVGEVANPGVDSITYSIEAENATNTTLSDLQLSAIIPGNTTFKECWAENRGTNQCQVQDGKVTWFIPRLGPQFEKTSRYVFTVVNVPAGIINSQATLTWKGGIADPATGAGKISQSPVIKTNMPAEHPAAAAGEIPPPLDVPGMAQRTAIGMDVVVNKEGTMATFAIRATANEADGFFWGQQGLKLPFGTIYIPVSSQYYATIPNHEPIISCGWGFVGGDMVAGAPGVDCGVSADGSTVNWARRPLQNYWFTVPWDGKTTLTSQGWWTWGTFTGGVGMKGGPGAASRGIPNQDGYPANAQYAAPVSATPALLKSPKQNNGMIAGKPFDAGDVGPNGIPMFKGLIIGYGTYLPNSFGITANVSADKSMVTYAMRYRNGASAYAGVKFFGLIPPGTTLVSSWAGVPGQNAGYVDEYGSIAWNIPVLSAYTSSPLYVWTVKTNGQTSLVNKGYMTWVGGPGHKGLRPVPGNVSPGSPNGTVEGSPIVLANGLTLGLGTQLNESETSELHTSLLK